MLDLETGDWKFVGGVLLVWAAVAAISGYAGIARYGPMVELPFDIITGVLGAATLYYIWRIVRLHGGLMGRYLAIIGIGTGFFALTLAPHIWMHVNHPMFAEFFGFMHVATFWAFLLIAYGFYLLTTGGET